MNVGTGLRSQLKQRAVYALRAFGLLNGAERMRERWAGARERSDNETFCRQNPDFVPPPLPLMHDAYGSVSYRTYWTLGQYFARFFADLIHKHSSAPRRVLEWGCGPARILRHMPQLLPEADFVGSDYNVRSISWCRTAIRGIDFKENGLSPPLPFPDHHFDVIYAVSVLTHLSTAQAHAWIKELRRVLRSTGCLIVTTNGERSATILLPNERRSFEQSGVVVRDQVEEGKRCFVAFHKPSYLTESLFADLKVCEHRPGLAGAPATEQDIWVLRQRD